MTRARNSDFTKEIEYIRLLAEKKIPVSIRNYERHREQWGDGARNIRSVCRIYRTSLTELCRLAGVCPARRGSSRADTERFDRLLKEEVDGIKKRTARILEEVRREQEGLRVLESSKRTITYYARDEHGNIWRVTRESYSLR